MDDELDDVWDKVGGAAPDADETVGADGDDEGIEVGPPIRVTIVVKADTIPVAPWAQGWSIGAIGPHEGHVTLVCEHEMDQSPVAQLSAITGILGTVKQAQLDLVWWAIQTRGPLEPPAEDDVDAGLSKLLGGT
jgi:hypothetical protein